MVDTQGATEVVPFLTSGALIMYAQRYLKSRESYMKVVEAIPMADVWIHRIVAMVGSLAAGLGIHLTIAGSFDVGWTLHALIPNGWELMHAVGDVGKVYVLQQLSYDATRKPFTMPHDQPSAVVANQQSIPTTLTTAIDVTGKGAN